MLSYLWGESKTDNTAWLKGYKTMFTLQRLNDARKPFADYVNKNGKKLEYSPAWSYLGYPVNQDEAKKALDAIDKAKENFKDGIVKNIFTALENLLAIYNSTTGIIRDATVASGVKAAFALFDMPMEKHEFENKKNLLLRHIEEQAASTEDHSSQEKPSEIRDGFVTVEFKKT